MSTFLDSLRKTISLNERIAEKGRVAEASLPVLKAMLKREEARIKRGD